MFRKREWVLLAGLLIVYNINLRQVSSHDTYASRFLPISILRDGDAILDEFVPEEMKQRIRGDWLSDNFVYVRGHFYDSHPPIGPLLALPVYALPAWIGIPQRAELAANLFSKLAASIMAALSAVVLFLASKRLLRATSATASPSQREIALEDRTALLAAVTYALATSVWSTASLAMWTHTPAVLGFAVALWALTIGRAGLAGVAVAAACFARPATVPAAAMLGVYLLHRTLRDWWMSTGESRSLADVLWFSTGLGLAGLAGVLYNYSLFGNAVGGAPFRTEVWFRLLGTRDMFSGSLPVGFAGLTISPNRGILIYSPVVLLAVYGALRAWRSSLTSGPQAEVKRESFRRADAILLARYASLAALAILLTYSKFIAWWGGHGYGPRYLTDAMPFVGILFPLGLSPLVEGASPSRIGRTLAIAVFAYSLFIQALGAFCWPSGWTLNDPPYRFRLWDWSETEIEVCLKEGPRVDPAARQLFRRLGF